MILFKTQTLLSYTALDHKLVEIVKNIIKLKYNFYSYIKDVSSFLDFHDLLRTISVIISADEFLMKVYYKAKLFSLMFHFNYFFFSCCNPQFKLSSLQQFNLNPSYFCLRNKPVPQNSSMRVPAWLAKMRKRLQESLTI